MPRYVAFLRGMNLGGRRITNPELCAAFERLGYEEVSAFLASGNVVFEAAGEETKLRRELEAGLAEELGYEVPTFLRSANQVGGVVAHEAFAERDGADARGKLQVVFLQKKPSPEGAGLVASLDGDDDWLELMGREIFWWPSGGLSQSELDLKALAAAVGPTTVRTMNTVRRLAAKHL